MPLDLFQALPASHQDPVHTPQILRDLDALAFAAHHRFPREIHG
jgi:hypothetical protein